MNTYMQKTAEVERNWHIIDAQGKILGEVAAQAATWLIGKHKPTYTPHIDAGDYVVVINAAQVAVTGRKETDKMYYRHSGQPGGFRQETLGNLRQRAPERIIEAAVKGMLPKNKLQADRIVRLKVFAAAEHPYSDKLKAA